MPAVDGPVNNQHRPKSVKMPSRCGAALEEVVYLTHAAATVSAPPIFLVWQRLQWKVIKARNTLLAVTALFGGIDPR